MMEYLKVSTAPAVTMVVARAVELGVKTDQAVQTNVVNKTLQAMETFVDLINKLHAFWVSFWFACFVALI